VLWELPDSGLVPPLPWLDEFDEHAPMKSMSAAIAVRGEREEIIRDSFFLKACEGLRAVVVA
jgi:hypothetical protein